MFTKYTFFLKLIIKKLIPKNIVKKIYIKNELRFPGGPIVVHFRMLTWTVDIGKQYYGKVG